MWLLIAEALLALALLVFIVMWTMSGRRRSEHAEIGDEASGALPNATREVRSSDSKRR